jgi:WD40 repeat protein
MVTMLFKTNIFGIVGSDNNPEYKQNIALIWDDLNSSILLKVSLKEKILNLKLSHNKILIVSKSKIYVFDLKSFNVIDKIDTIPNPLGLLGLNYTKDKTILVYPSSNEDKKKGDITIKNIEQKKCLYITPHNHPVAYITLSYNGLLLATASEEGKKIRIFETVTGEYLQELNRGSEKAKIKCICIDFNNQFIAASSERGTIHIWSLKESYEAMKKSGKVNLVEEGAKNNVSNVGSVFSIIPNFLGGGYFKKEWSFTQVRLDEPYSNFHFGAENILIIITSTGKYYKAKIDIEKGGDCQILDEVALF